MRRAFSMERRLEKTRSWKRCSRTSSKSSERIMSLESGTTLWRLNQELLPEPGRPMARTTMPFGARCVTVAAAGGLGACSTGDAAAATGSTGCRESFVSGRTEGVIPLGVKACATACSRPRPPLRPRPPRRRRLPGRRAASPGGGGSMACGTWYGISFGTSAEAGAAVAAGGAAAAGGSTGGGARFRLRLRVVGGRFPAAFVFCVGCRRLLLGVEICGLQRRRSRLVRRLGRLFLAALKTIAHPFTHVRLVTHMPRREQWFAVVSRNRKPRRHREFRVELGRYRLPPRWSDPEIQLRG